MTEVIVKEQLRQYINKIEKLEDEKLELTEEIKGVFDEAKSNGFDIKAMRQVLKLRKMDKDDLAQQEAILELYREALDL